MSPIEKALMLAARGWKVFPCGPDKRPLTEHGFYDATDDADTVATWWSVDSPNALIGVWAGGSGIIALDLDVKNGKDGISAVAAEGLSWSSPMTYTTLSGAGRHAIFTDRNERSRPAVDYRGMPGVDIRAGGSYIIFTGDDPEAITPPAPEWMLDARPIIPLDTPYDGDIADWLAECAQGEPRGYLDTLAARLVERVKPGAIGHAELLHYTEQLVKLGAMRVGGVPEAIESLRDAYLIAPWNTPHYRRDFDAALAGAITKWGAFGSDWSTADIAAAEPSEDEDLEAIIERMAANRVLHMEADRRAKLIMAESAAGAIEYPDPVRLDELLTRKLPESKYLVTDVLPLDGTVLFSAQRKAGKTTLIGNLIRSLVDGDAFLDYFEVEDTRTVALMDFELSPTMLQRWLGEQAIKHTERLQVVSLRGQGAAFDIRLPSVRARWAEKLRGVGTLMVDPIGPIIQAMGLNEWNEAGVFLDALAALKHEAGIRELIAVHHHGHNADHARGDSRLEGWPDALWRLTRDDMTDPRAWRYFDAYGRDVDVDKGLLSMYEGKRLAFSSDATGSRDERLVANLVEAIRKRGELNTSAIEKLGIRGVSKNSVRGLLDQAVAAGLLEVRAGEKNAKLYRAPLLPG